MTDIGHARFAPSSADRWLNCPASVLLSEKVATPPSGRAAEIGTFKHALAAVALEHAHIAKLSLLPDDVHFYVAEVLAYLAGDQTPLSELYIEQYVKLQHDLYGTSDAFYYSKKDGVLRVFDFKSGKIPVESAWNAQMLLYAEGARQFLQGTLAVNVLLIETIIIQPNAEHSLGPKRSTIYTRYDLQDWKERARVIIQQVETEPDTLELKAGKWCIFCPVKSTCKEGRAYAHAERARDRLSNSK